MRWIGNQDQQNGPDSPCFEDGGVHFSPRSHGLLVWTAKIASEALMKIKRAEKYGFCAGVRIADKKVKKFAEMGGRDGQILGQVVHNERVADEMANLGVPTIDALEEAESGTIVFSAHGVPSGLAEARARVRAVVQPVIAAVPVAIVSFSSKPGSLK